MRAIQCYSSFPITQGRHASGHFGSVDSISLTEPVKLCMKLSALQYRRTNGNIKLYTDSAMRDYLAKEGLLSCWDDVNTDVLDNFRDNYPEINHSVFWSSGKFACYMNEPAPFVCIDADIVIWQKLKFERDLAFSFTHWESIELGDESYPALSKIHRPKNYTLHQVQGSRLFDSYACNMAITYFGNDEFKQEFSMEAIEFMRSNDVDHECRYATPEILYMEQRMPLALVLERGLSYSPVIDLTWSPKRFQITQAPSEYKHWFFSDLNTSKIFTHLWFHKKYLAENEKANAEYCARLRELIEEVEA